jgi:hypothetical protein
MKSIPKLDSCVSNLHMDLNKPLDKQFTRNLLEMRFTTLGFGRIDTFYLPFYNGIRRNLKA